jgi:DNA-binding response OmpR family regulator
VRILLVEDEVEFAVTLKAALEKERLIVDHVETISEGNEAAAHGGFDLVLLDRTLPDGEGVSLMPALRAEWPGLPIIILSARGDIHERVTGLDSGADDYLPKPFALDELLARIRAVRRRPSEVSNLEVRVGALVFDVVNEEAFLLGNRLELPRRELLVLGALVKRVGRTVLRETLEKAVYGFDDAVQSNTLDSHISRLRRKLADGNSGVRIHTIRGVGYLLNAVP